MSLYDTQEKQKAEEKRKVLAEKADLAYKQSLADIKEIAGTEAGQRFFTEMIRNCKFFETSYNQDKGFSSFIEGHRNVALMYINKLGEACPERVQDILIPEELEKE